jgi:hypothetical protein
MSEAPQEPVRCPACGQQALPHQDRCPSCNCKLNESAPAEGPAPAPAAADNSAGIVAAGPREEGTYALADADQPPARERRCPACAAALSESAVLCVSCGYDFRLGKARATVVEKVEEETPQDRRRRLAPPLSLVLYGLTLHNARILVSLLATVLILGLMAYAAAQKAGPTVEQRTWVALVLLAGVGLWLLGIVLGLVGSILCFWLPDSRGRFVLSLALVLDVVTLPAGVVAVVLAWTPLLSWAIGLGSWALFMLFLARLADVIDRPSEAREGRTLLLFGLLLVTIPAMLGTIAARDPFAGTVVILYFLPTLGVIFFGVQFHLIRLLETLRASIRQQIDEVEREERREAS